MKKKMDLKTFNMYEYLKEKHANDINIPYFLATQEMYKNASIQFPLRNFFYGIGITYTGDNGLVKISSMEYRIPNGSLITIGPGIVSQWQSDYSGIHDTIFFTEELFNRTITISFLKSLPFFAPGGNHVLVLNDEYVSKIKSIFDALKQFKDDSEVIPGLVYSLIMLSIKCHAHPSKQKQHTGSMQEKIANDFNCLLAKHFLERKDVVFYAGELNMTPKYLSEVLMDVTGKTAKTLINDHIFMEAKSLLRQTSMTVQEICYWLGYADTSYFTKAFKKQEGIAPAEYRKL